MKKRQLWARAIDEELMGISEFDWQRSLKPGLKETPEYLLADVKQMPITTNFEIMKDAKIWIADTGASNHSTFRKIGIMNAMDSDLGPKSEASESDGNSSEGSTGDLALVGNSDSEKLDTSKPVGKAINKPDSEDMKKSIGMNEADYDTDDEILLNDGNPHSGLVAMQNYFECLEELDTEEFLMNTEVAKNGTELMNVRACIGGGFGNTTELRVMKYKGP